MRRVLVVLVLAVALVIAAASAAAADSRVNPPVPAQQTSTGGSGSQPPAIVPNPNERGTNNIGGLVVGVVLLGGWLAGGTVILVRARRRVGHARAAELATLPGAP